VTGPKPTTTNAVLRCVPDAGSGDTITAQEIAERLGLRPANVQQVLSRAMRRGDVVRVRFGVYQLAGKR
jgi:predicted transcriptional regulator of viral defense system